MSRRLVFKTEEDRVFDVLSRHHRRPGFMHQWRQFERASSLPLLSQLLAAAADWFAAADRYDRGQLDDPGLLDVRHQAWTLERAARRAKSLALTGGLRAVMCRLWPAGSPADWHDSACFYFAACSDAGLSFDRLLPNLRAEFPDILGSPAEV